MLVLNHMKSFTIQQTVFQLGLEHNRKKHLLINSWMKKMYKVFKQNIYFL